MGAVKIPDILLPRCELSKWATVACDQFTAEPSYWETLTRFIGDAPSTLNLVVPEIYINNGLEEKITSVKKHMSEYVRSGLFESYRGFVLTVRTLGGKTRVGLVAAVDLEEYDWRNVRSEIRATEETIEERLPLRVEIRRSAELELPHVLTLLDDPERHIIEPLFERREKFRKLYDFDLNMGGGHVAGYLIENEEAEKIVALTEELLKPETQIEKYGYDAGVLLAVGDGNHSLATAKSYWESLKPQLSEEQRLSHPARFALAEIDNLYDDGIEFEPIHRLVFGGDRALFAEKLKSFAERAGAVIKERDVEISEVSGNAPSSSLIKIAEEAVSALKKEGASIDYIHGEDKLREAVKSVGGLGIILPRFEKSELFGYMLRMGRLPKKAFSIGSAEFKRYYLESRLIKLED